MNAIRSLQMRIISGNYPYGYAKGNRVQDIFSMCLSEFLIEVDQDNLIGSPVQGNSVGAAASDGPTSHDIDQHRQASFIFRESNDSMTN